MKKSSFRTPWIALLLALIFSGLLTRSIGEPPTLTLAFLGDVMLGRGISQAHTDANWEETFSPIIPALRAADLALANLESPLSANPPSIQGSSTGYNLCAPAGSIGALTAAGFDILTLENNHAQDCSNDAFPTTASILLDAGLAPLQGSMQPVQRSIKGIRLAFLAFDDVSRQALHEEAACEAVSAARSSGSLVIVSMHWGSEFQGAPNPRQEMLAQALADCGAALIWGHHPHVLQPAAWVQGAGQPSPTLVLYSLGNALFDQFSPPDAARSALLLVTLDAGGVRNWEAIPFKIDALDGKMSTADEVASSAVLNRLDINRTQPGW